MVPFSQIGFCLGSIIFNILTWYVKESDHLLFVTAIFLILVVLPNFFFLEESPKFLYQKGRISELAYTLGNIGRINGSSVTSKYFSDKLGIDTQFDDVAS